MAYRSFQSILLFSTLSQHVHCCASCCSALVCFQHYLCSLSSLHTGHLFVSPKPLLIGWTRPTVSACLRATVTYSTTLVALHLWPAAKVGALLVTINSLDLCFLSHRGTSKRAEKFKWIKYSMMRNKIQWFVKLVEIIVILKGIKKFYAAWIFYIDDPPDSGWAEAATLNMRHNIKVKEHRQCFAILLNV